MHRNKETPEAHISPFEKLKAQKTEKFLAENLKGHEELTTDYINIYTRMKKEYNMTKKLTVPQIIKDKLQSIRNNKFPLDDLINMEDGYSVLGNYVNNADNVSSEEEHLILLYLSGSSDVELVAEGVDLKAGDEVVLPDGSLLILDTDVSLSGSVTNE